MIEKLVGAVIEAGQTILDVRSRGMETGYKADSSPVTVADKNAEEILTRHLTDHFPFIPVIAEESFSDGHMPALDGGRFFLVDPLDGTREFINGHDDFTVNIALIENGLPVAGIVSAPAKNMLWCGEYGVAKKYSILASGNVDAGITIGVRLPSKERTGLISRSHCNDRTRQFITDNAITNCVEAGSSLKFCVIAEGLADIYPRFSPTMMWDTAAGDAVLRAAGGITLDENGGVLTYNVIENEKHSLRNPGFVAYGGWRPDKTA